MSPNNILYDPATGAFDTFKIIDFGTALSKEYNDKKTIKATRIGTPHYVAPEQLNEGIVTERNDVYSLGAIFYFLLTGSNPPKDGNVSPKTTAPVSENINNIVYKATNRYRKERFASVEELLRALEGKPLIFKNLTFLTLWGKQYRITKDETIIGRSPLADIVIKEGDDVIKKYGGYIVSREHCKLVKDSEGDYFIQDMGSTNGTWFYDDDKKMWVRVEENEKCYLEDGDIITFAYNIERDEHYITMTFNRR